MITAKELRKLKRDNTKMLALNYGSNVTGNVIIANDVGTWAAKEQIAYFLDVSQSIGSYPLDVSILQPDFMAFSGHKSLLGPTGVGCLFMKQRTQLPLYRYGGTGSRSMKDWIEPIRASDYETGTLNVLGIVGLKTSIEYILNIGLQNYIEHKRNLTTYFLSKIRNIDNIKIYNDFRHHQLPIVSLNIHNITPQLVAQILDQEHQIITRSGLHCAPWAHKEMGTYPDGTVRMSFGYTHSFDNIDRLINAILDIQRKFKGNWL
jgi:selenocysteine lyase/cysteine desulfurase